MSDKILVAYASRADSTAGIAEAIGRTLAENGLQVDVLSMQEITNQHKNLAPYRAVVAGSAIQGGKWLPEAMVFMHTYQAELEQKPFAAFLVCMTLAMRKGDYRKNVATWLAPVRSLVRPVSEGLFTGALDISKIPSIGDRIKFRISVILGVWPEGDQRDWEAIRTWAISLPPLLAK